MQQRTTPQHEHGNTQQTFELPPAAKLSMADQKLLKDFHKRMDKLQHVVCPVCNESCPSIVLVKGKCQRCYSEKIMPNKFSADNNMDPGDIPEELQDLTEIEEMLIARAFTVMSIYRLRGGQYGYRGNVVNFPQDICEFATRLPRHPIVIGSSNHTTPFCYDLTAFRDFTVRRAKVACALREELAIKSTLNRIQFENPPMTWPQIDNSPINEFQTPGYIAMAFPTLYPTGKADLHAEHIRDIKPAEYFKHLLRYKDGRFGQHTCWRYFALNSQMRWQALQEGKIYVKQNLNDDELTVNDIQERIATGDKHMADWIMQYGHGNSGWHGDLMPERNTKKNEYTKCYHTNLVDNPHVAAWFFNERFEKFFNHVLKKHWNLEDWWYRFEWQHRGSVHVHGIGKIKHGPTIEWEKIKDDENAMNEIVKYANSLVTTINPGINAPIPNRHPCQKNHSELQDDLQDYIDLINKLQRHTRCSPSYCIHLNQKENRYVGSNILKKSQITHLCMMIAMADQNL
ncbi:4193_t:CDS:2 [Paraglomus occultum]|uniref:4193_t:CDS:1 n=1 Tax=Paraglomus occultum TaxID=144539 RepID=A0A9N8ZQT3_9GLOM|nr:4193_t:CDS:2 [Paraglomus occultum]